MEAGALVVMADCPLVTAETLDRLAKHELHLGSFLTMDQMLASIDAVKHEIGKDTPHAIVAEMLPPKPGQLERTSKAMDKILRA